MNKPLKLTAEDLANYLYFRRRGSIKKNKKGKGSYKRNKTKREEE